MSESKRKRYNVPDIFQSPCNKVYVLGEFLDRGAYADCYKVNCDNNDYAAKFISKRRIEKSKQTKMFMQNEIGIHSKLDHPNIVKIIDTFETISDNSDSDNSDSDNSDSDNSDSDTNDSDTYIVIIMELCAETLLDIITKDKNLKEDDLRIYIPQIISGLKYLHENNIIHRDIKPSNILLQNGVIKICDFGMATYMAGDKKSICGTPNYIAPEVISGSIQTCRVDIWSLGVIIYAMRIGKAPFQTSSVKTTYRRIRDVIYYFPDRVKVTSDLKDLIKKILVRNPEDRLNLSEIINHKFFTEPTKVQKNISHNIIDLIHDKLDLKLGNKEDVNPPDKPDTLTNDPISWIARWKHDPHFGLFYEVNNGEFGSMFNDNTKMITINSEINYIRNIVSNNKRSTVKSKLNIDKEHADNNINKKILLVRRYIKHLPDIMEPVGTIQDTHEDVHIIKWLQTKNAIFFRLSNQTMQVHFDDENRTYNHGGIIISNECDTITYINNHNEMKSYVLSTIKNKSILCRLEYIQDMMKVLLKKR